MSADNSAPGGNIGNYKGVMLCNRPFMSLAGPSKATNGGDSMGKPAFAVGKPHDELGLHPIRKLDVNPVKREKKDTALSRHRKWLRDLQKEKERLQQELEESEKLKNERRKKFDEEQTQMRKAYREKEKTSDPAKEEEEETKDADRKAKKPSNRPMWALTENSAQKEVELREEEEADELLDFVRELDFDSYEEEMEAKTVMDAIEKRMKIIEQEVTREEKEADPEEPELDEEGNPLPPTAENKAMTLTAENLGKFSKHSGEGEKKGVDDDAVSVASTILSEAKALRHVHSSKSVAALARKAQEKLKAIEEDFEKEFPSNPRIVVTDEDQGARLKKKNDVSNLPYIHRNPAV